MKACIRWQFRVLGYAWWLLLLLPVLALLMGWEAIAALESHLHQCDGSLDARIALALVLDVRHFFPMAGVLWSVLFIGMDYGAEAYALALSRGYRNIQIMACKYSLFIMGCLTVSISQQVFTVLVGVKDWHTLPTEFLLRCFFLRLTLDVGMMIPPAMICFLGKNNLYNRLIGLVYGITLWRLMKSHYALWFRSHNFGMNEWLALWPIVAIVVSILYFVILIAQSRPHASPHSLQATQESELWKTKEDET